MNSVQWSASTDGVTTTYVGKSDAGEFLIVSSNGKCEVTLPKLPWQEEGQKRTAASSLEAMMLVNAMCNETAEREKQRLHGTQTNEPVGLLAFVNNQSNM